MKIINFIKWSWNNASLDGKISLILITIVFFSVPIFILFGPAAGSIFILSLAFLYFMFLSIFYTYTLITETWKEYNNVLAQEAEDIVDKLRG